jgi:hypothetical protein
VQFWGAKIYGSLNRPLPTSERVYLLNLAYVIFRIFRYAGRPFQFLKTRIQLSKSPINTTYRVNLVAEAPLRTFYAPFVLSINSCILIESQTAREDSDSSLMKQPVAEYGIFRNGWESKTKFCRLNRAFGEQQQC